MNNKAPMDRRLPMDRVAKEFKESLESLEEAMKKKPGTIVIEDEPKRPVQVRTAKDFPIETWGIRVLEETLKLRSESEIPGWCDHIETLPPGTAILWMIPKEEGDPSPFGSVEILKLRLREAQEELAQTKLGLANLRKTLREL